MHHRTWGIVIALAAAAAGGLLPLAVSEFMAATYVTAAGLGTVVLMNAVIATVHIASAPNEMRDEIEAEAMDAPVLPLRSMNSRDVPLNVGNRAPEPKGRSKASKEPLDFPVIGWYAAAI
jgi:hypothetical protein